MNINVSKRRVKKADRCEIQISYAIGVAQPVSLLVDTFGTGVTSDESIQNLRTFRIDIVCQKLGIYTRISGVLLLVETLDEFQRAVGDSLADKRSDCYQTAVAQ